MDLILFDQKNISINKTEDYLIGVYFLFYKSEIVYIGQSLNIIQRVNEHKKNGKIFDEYNYILYSKELLDLKETDFIMKFLPKYNNSIPSGDNGYISEIKLKRVYGIGKILLTRFLSKRSIKTYNLNNKRYFSINDIKELLG